MSTDDLFHGGDRPRRAMQERLDALFGRGGDVPARWVPRRLILQNYWLYPYQEFHFGNGRLMLRGPNGSGKTSVLVSAVTLALDGDKGRSRLDPFRQGGRSIAYYLVGKGEAEEDGGFYYADRTGYVAVEFQHGADGRFLTVGVGMRGRRLSDGGTPRVDSWGFVVRDGRRVGRNRELALTTTEGVPLTRTELAERIAPAGAVVERMSDYRAEVNRALFGFTDEEDYAFLVQILLALRSPKLNKELKPNDVAEILSDSLPPLDPALLERVTQIMDDIDATRADIAATEANRERVERVHHAVGRYLNQIAQRRALDYRERQADVEEVHEKLLEARERAAAARDENERARERLREVDRELADVRGRLKVLGNHEAYRARDALTAVEKEVARRREHHAATRDAVQETRRDIAGLEKQRSGLRDRWTEQRLAGMKAASDLADAARAAAWAHPEQIAGSVGEGVEALDLGVGEVPELHAEALAELAEARGRRLSSVLEALAAVADAERELERANSVVRQAQADLREGHESLRLAREGVESGRDELTVRLERWQRELEELPVQASDVAELRARIHGIEDSADLQAPALFDSVVGRASRHRGELEADRDRARSRSGLLELRREETRAELEEWERRDEAVPEPRPGQVEARARVGAAEITAVPLFRAVEVRRFLPEERARPLQAALREAGLLDALVVRGDDVEGVEHALGAEGGDRWIRPQPLAEGAATLADVLEPASCELSAADVMAALRSVALGDDGKEASAGVTADGRWRVGLLEGRPAPPTSDAPLYLGREARVRERDRRVERLRSTLGKLDEELERVRDEIGALGGRLGRLDAELELLRELPEIGFLSRALTVQAERSGQVGRLNQRLQDAEARTAAARRAVGDARQRHETALREAPETRGRDTGGVQELIGAGDRVVTVAERLADRLTALRLAAQELDRIRSAMERQKTALDNAMTRETEAAEAVAEEEARVRTIETELRELGFEEITEEVHRSEVRQEELEAEGRSLVGTIERSGVSLEHTDREATRLEGERVRSEAERAEARARLAEAIHAYPTLHEVQALFGEGTEGDAGRAADQLLARRDEASGDLRRRIEDDRTRAFQVLSQEVVESRSQLIDYHPNLDPETGAVTFRHEGRELPPHALLEILVQHRRRQTAVMREKEDELYEEFFLQEVGGRIREAIERAEESVERVNALLAERPLANDETLSLRWRPLREIGADGADYPRLVELLKKPASVLPPEDVRWIKSFFRARVQLVREDAAQGAPAAPDDHTSFAEALKAVLDYRRWFFFTIHGKRPDEPAAEITNREFAARSGGEKSLAMFVPLLAAVDARFRIASPDAPKLVGLDEAFAGVDSDNINEMYAFMVGLDLSWIMTSEKLWGVGAALPVCTTYQFHRRGTIAAVQPWLWDGRSNLDEASLTISAPAEEVHGGRDSGAA